MTRAVWEAHDAFAAEVLAAWSAFAAAVERSRRRDLRVVNRRERGEDLEMATLPSAGLQDLVVLRQGARASVMSSGRSRSTARSTTGRADMHVVRLAPWIVLVGACTPAIEVPASGPPDGGWQTGSYAIEHDGRRRTFLLDVPDDLQPGAPLVLVIHGYTGQATDLRDYTGFDAISKEHGFVAVYPQGTRDARGQTFFDVGYDFHTERVDDVGFLRALADRLVVDLEVDADSVFATGHSNGGDMSYVLACQTDAWVRAIAPVSGTMMADNACTPSRRTSVMEVHGTADDITYFEGDPENVDGWGAYLSTNEVMDFWVDQLDLELEETSALPDLDRDDGSTVALTRWSTAVDDEEVRLYLVEDGGHDWPGAWGNGDLQTSEAIWDFFEAHRP